MKLDNRLNPLLIAAWITHFIAWFVPVHAQGVRFPDGLPGWQAFNVALSVFHEPRSFTAIGGLVAALSAIDTVLFVFASPLVVLLASRRWQWSSAWAASAAFVVNAEWFVMDSERRHLEIGYYLWCLSFALLAAGLFKIAIPRRDARSAVRT